MIRNPPSTVGYSLQTQDPFIHIESLLNIITISNFPEEVQDET